MDAANEFESEEPTAVTAYVSLAETAAQWRAELRRARPTEVQEVETKAVGS